jgi:hypothetical protein
VIAIYHLIGVHGAVTAKIIWICLSRALPQNEETAFSNFFEIFQGLNGLINDSYQTTQ